jgi:hypothetical protein
LRYFQLSGKLPSLCVKPPVNLYQSADSVVQLHGSSMRDFDPAYSFLSKSAAPFPIWRQYALMQFCKLFDAGSKQRRGLVQR